ncbi:hypothetical protein HFD88_000120 [Aspergillus terreus]|nr:hypothetical protein HFD88_000120 [Aspergillus terreus]
MLRWKGSGQGSTPLFLQARSSSAFIVFVASFAVFTDLFLYGMIVPVVPTALRERVGLPEKDVQRWVSILMALFGATQVAASPVAGYLADRIESRWWPLMAGLVMLAVSTSLLCVGTTLGLWVAGRLFQGASGAIVWSVGCALVVDSVEPERIGQALGYIALGMTLGVMAGPLLGGVIYEHGGYYAVFGLAFALVGLDICFRLVMIEKKYAARWLPPPRADPSSTEDQASQNSVPQQSEGQTQSQASYREKTPDQPTEHTTFDKKRKPAVIILLSSARLIVALWAYFIMSMIISSFDTVLPLFVHDTFGWQQTAQGLIFIPIAIPNFLEPVTGYINDKFERARRFLAAGALLGTVPAIVCLRFVSENTIAQKVLLCALLAVIGLCLATYIPPVLAEVSYIVQKKEQENPHVFGTRGATALAYGLMNGAYATGLLVAPFLAGFIRDSAGWNTMTWALALFPGISSIPVVLVLGGFPFSPKRARC